MADAGGGEEIGRDDDALRWALATEAVVSAASDWVAVPIAGQRAVTMTPGQGQAAQITMPELHGAKTPTELLQLPFTGSQTRQGKLICREITWYGIEDDPPVESRFVVLDEGDYVEVPFTPALLSTVAGLEQVPAQKYLVPLWLAVVHQTSNEIVLWDYRNWIGRGAREWARITERSAPSGVTVPKGSRYNQTARTLRVPEGRTGMLRVTASLSALFTALATAGYLCLEIDGVTQDRFRFHNNDTAGLDRPAWRWDVPLSEGQHSVRVFVTMDTARGMQMRDLQSTILLEI